MACIIDANSGAEIKPGVEFENILGHVKVLEARVPSLFENLFFHIGPVFIAEINGKKRVISGRDFIRNSFHPSFFLQTIYFWNT